MSFRQRHWTAPFRVSAGLIVCLASAVTAAEPALVPPDEAAALLPVVEIDWPDEATSPSVSSPVWQEPTLASSVPGSWEDAPSIPLSPGRREQVRPQVPIAADVPELSVIEFDSFFTTDAGLPPVVRGQSPEIDLLPLATGESAIENTSILSAVTGTKGRIRADWLTDFDQTERIGVQAVTQIWNGVGIDTEANYWQRPVAGLGNEPLWTGDLNILYSFPPHPRFKLRSGAGLGWTIDDGDFHTGYNVTHGIDVYLLWRFMATGELDWGQIDSDKLFRYRLALGLTFKLCEVYTGYESYELGPERLDGWVNGIAFWY